MKNMPRSLCSGHVKKLQPKKIRFCVGGVFGRRAFSLFSFFSMSDCRAGFFEALRNIVRSFRAKGSEMVWEKPKETQKWSGGSPESQKSQKSWSGRSSEIGGAARGRVKPKKILKWSGKSPEAQKGSKKLSGRSSTRCRNGSETVLEELKKKGAEIVREEPQKAQKLSGRPTKAQKLSGRNSKRLRNCVGEAQKGS